jgi:hypothetical protein
MKRKTGQIIRWDPAHGWSAFRSVAISNSEVCGRCPRSRFYIQVDRICKH